MFPVRSRPARVARLIPRRPPGTTFLWWTAVILAALATAAFVYAALARAASAEARWGRSRTVLVAIRPIAPGNPFDGGVVARRLPQVAVPSGALADLPPGRVAVASIGRGEIVTRARVSDEPAAGPTGLIPRGTRAVVVPLEVMGLPVRVGDRVDLLASGTGDLPAAAGSTPPSAPVATHALVLVTRPSAVVVALPQAAAVRVAAALGQGPLVPALEGPAG